MKNRNLFVGVVLVCVGIISLLATLDVFEFRWSIVWRLWPMILVIIGIMVLPIKDWLKTVFLLLALAVSVFLYRYELNNRQFSWPFSQNATQARVDWPCA